MPKIIRSRYPVRSAALAIAVRSRRAYAHRNADVRSRVDQAIEGEHVFASPQPAHHPGREAELRGDFKVPDREFGNAVDRLARGRAGDRFLRLCGALDIVVRRTH